MHKSFLMYNVDEPETKVFYRGRCPLEVVRRYGVKVLPFGAMSGNVEVISLREGADLDHWNVKKTKYHVSFERKLNNVWKAKT